MISPLIKQQKKTLFSRLPATDKMHNQEAEKIAATNSSRLTDNLWRRKDTTTCEGSMTNYTNRKNKTAIAIVRAVGENENKI